MKERIPLTASERRNLNGKMSRSLERMTEMAGVIEFLPDDGIELIGYNLLAMDVAPEFFPEIANRILMQENLDSFQQYRLNRNLVTIEYQTMPEGCASSKLTNVLFNTYHTQLFMNKDRTFENAFVKTEELNFIRRNALVRAMKSASSIQIDSFKHFGKDFCRQLTSHRINVGEFLLSVQRQEEGVARLSDIFETGRAYKKASCFYDAGDEQKVKLLKKALLYYEVGFMQEDNDEEAHTKWYADAGEVSEMLAMCTPDKAEAELYMSKSSHYGALSKKLSDRYWKNFRKGEFERVPGEIITRLEERFSPVRRDCTNTSRFYSKDK